MLSGGPRVTAIRAAWREWEQTQGWKVIIRTEAEMAAAGVNAGNAMTLRTATRELWVNRALVDNAAADNATRLLRETAHEFAAHALAGRGGEFHEGDFPFINSWTNITTALHILENAITHEGGLERILNSFR
jgi:hypothetical protein